MVSERPLPRQPDWWSLEVASGVVDGEVLLSAYVGERGDESLTAFAWLDAESGRVSTGPGACVSTPLGEGIEPRGVGSRVLGVTGGWSWFEPAPYKLGVVEGL